MSYSIKLEQSSETIFEVEPVEGYTRSDIVIALEKKEAVIANSKIIQTRDNGVIATIIDTKKTTESHWV